MRARSRCSFPFLAALAALTAGCGAETGTFVKLLFDGNVNQDKPIASIAVDLQFGSRTSSTSFPMPTANPRLPTTGVLQIGSGVGTLYVSARALAGDGSVLGTGTGAGNVLSGKTVGVTVTFTGFVVGDAGTDGPEIDARPPGIDAGIDGGADGAADRASEVAIPPDLPPFIDGPGQDKPPLVDAPADAPDPAADVPLDVFGKDGAGGSGGTTTDGAGGTSTGGVGGGTGGTGAGGTSATYLLVVNPPAIDFGIVTPGSTSLPQTFTITNKGNAPAPALATFVSDPARFPIAQDTCKGMTLAPTATCTVSFTFAPTAPGTVRADGAVAPSAGTGTPAKFSLSGTGSGGAASLSLSPSPASFGIVDVNQSVSLPMTLTNGGDAAAGTVTIQAPSSSGFTVTSDACSGTILGRLSQCTFTLVFSPRAYGPASATVNALSSAGLSASASAVGIGRDHVSLTIQFSGNGRGTVNGVNPPCAVPGPCTVDVVRTDPAALPKFDLSAQPDALSVFGGWGGACTGTGTCSVVMDLARSVTATFNPRMVALNLTVLGLAGQTGTLTSEDGSITCSGNCPGLSVPAASTFTLLAQPGGGSTFAAWTGGPCKGIDPKCIFSLTGTVSITATFGPQSYMFVSSTTVVPGKLGGIDAADVQCRTLADNARLPGKYFAWLSTSTVGANERVGEGGWIRTDGRPFARDLKTLADPSYLVVFYPPRLDERGNDLGNVRIPVATGSGPTGAPAGTQCADYQDTAGSLNVGDASSGSSAWTSRLADAKGCATAQHLYCFRGDLPGTLITPAAQPGRRVFATTLPFVLRDGLTPDELCWQDADAAGIPDPKAFVAFLATSTLPALKRVNLTGAPWKRMDGVFIVEQPTNLGDGKLLAPVDATADGKTYTTAAVWTGANGPRAEGTATCGDWGPSPVLAPGIAGDSQTSTAPDWFSATTIACSNTTTHLMCIEP